jgi:hypothetical protein
MNEYVKQRAAATQWLHERQNLAQWWGWAVLTKHNPHHETIGLPDTVAFNIFTDLASRGLLVPTVTDDGREAFKLNLGDDKAWNSLMNPPGFFKIYIWRPAGLVLSASVKFILWLASLLIAGYVGWLFK